MAHGKRNNQHRLAPKGQPPAKLTRQPVMTDGCGKKGYMTKADAKLALRVLRGVRRAQAAAGIAAGGGEQSPYRCEIQADGRPGCGLWHLTSLPRGVSAEISRVRKARGARAAK